MNNDERLGHLIRKHRARITGYRYNEDPFEDTPAEEMRRLLDAADLGLYWSIESGLRAEKATRIITELEAQRDGYATEHQRQQGLMEIERLKLKDLGFSSLDSLIADYKNLANQKDASITDVLPAVPDSDLPF